MGVSNDSRGGPLQDDGRCRGRADGSPHYFVNSEAAVRDHDFRSLGIEVSCCMYCGVEYVRLVEAGGPLPRIQVF